LFFGWHKREKFGCFLTQEGGIYFFQGIILLMLWGGVFGGSRWVVFFGLFFFCDMVI